MSTEEKDTPEFEVWVDGRDMSEARYYVDGRLVAAVIDPGVDPRAVSTPRTSQSLS